jgi:predicted restriction endonuclease
MFNNPYSYRCEVCGEEIHKNPDGSDILDGAEHIKEAHEVIK